MTTHITKAGSAHMLDVLLTHDATGTLVRPFLVIHQDDGRVARVACEVGAVGLDGIAPLTCATPAKGVAHAIELVFADGSSELLEMPAVELRSGDTWSGGLTL